MKEHLIVSIDWSGIELVEIGEFSGDPEFIKAFSQIPHEDLHSGAAADILTVEVPELTEKLFKDLKKTPDWGSYPVLQNIERLKTNLKGELIELPGNAFKYWRTEVGKGANFNYFYSGWLSTIGERMGWSQETTKLATDRYKERFKVAEEWRLNLISEVQRDGYITLPDGHRHVRYEATEKWLLEFMMKFEIEGAGDYNALMNWIAHKIRKRSFNQAVNAYIQGTCATIAKRSILRVDDEIKKQKWDARFMMPIHDELLWSVNVEIVPEFVAKAREIMITHPDLFKLCKLDASPAIGITFEPWSPKSPAGQIELFEPPAELGLGNDRLDQAGIRDVCDYLIQTRRASSVA